MAEQSGRGAAAAAARESALAGGLRGTAAADTALAGTVAGAGTAAQAGRDRLAVIDAAVRAAATAGRDTPAGVRQLHRLLIGKLGEIERVVTDTAADDARRAAAVDALTRRYRPGPPGPDPAGGGTIALDHGGKLAPPDPQPPPEPGPGPGPGPESEPDRRRRNQVAAFTEVFHRPPLTPVDWSTAAALDAHTYRPEFDGTDAQVRVVRIDPVAGQGLVRAGQWIAQRDVLNPPRRDLGNDRGPDPRFDPEDTKVTSYVDYTNGVVVLRQNPSVEVGGGSRQVRVGAPTGSVSQAADGSVRIRYQAANPFAPGILTAPPGPIASHGLSVNGDLVFRPGPDGVQVGGTRTDYPSLEVYQDVPGAPTRTVLVDPAHSGRMFGPVTDLPFHHDVGLGGAAFAPFAGAPTAAFGPTSAAPSVAHRR